MSYTKVLGKCCNSDCSKKSSGKCQSFSEGIPANICGYCGCHEGAHTFICHLPPAAPAPVVAAPAPIAAPTTPARAGPSLQQRKLVQEERKRIFQPTGTPQSAAKTTPKKKAKITEAPIAVVKKVAAKPKEIIPDNEENRRLDRAEALLEVAGEGVTLTDLDTAAFWRVNGVPWMPEVFEVDTVVDFTKYCFACLTQLTRSDREVCTHCSRFMFVDCGHFGYIEAEDLGDEVAPDHFRCCDCKDYTFKRSQFQDHFDSLPKRMHGCTGAPTNSRFSNAF